MKDYRKQIEWYPDGFTMEEQAELRKQAKEQKYIRKFANVKFMCTIPESDKLAQADKYISTLKVQLGQEKEYAEELEDTIKQLKKQIHDAEVVILKENEKVHDLENQLEAEKLKVKKVQDKYSSDVQQAVKLDDIYIRQEKEIKAIEEENTILKNNRDKLIAEIIKLRDERNS